MSSNDTSPVTGIIEENQVIFDFGKYEGRTVSDVALMDPEFYGMLAQKKEAGTLSLRRHKDKSFRLYLNPNSSMDQ